MTVACEIQTVDDSLDAKEVRRTLFVGGGFVVKVVVGAFEVNKSAKDFLRSKHLSFRLCGGCA